MAPTTHSLKSVSERQDMVWVMVLPPPPSPWEATDWYWKKIAGVPFLLRNILSIQQNGAKRLHLLADKGLDRIEELYLRAKNDSRVHLDLQCCSEPKKLIASSKSINRLVFLDGSFLQNTKVDEENSQSGQGLVLDVADFESLLQDLDNCGLLPRLNNLTNPPQKISPNAENRLGVMKGTEDWKITRPEDFEKAEHRLIKSCGLNNDSFMDQFVTRFISRQMTRQVLKTSIPPNTITLLSCLLGLASAACFLSGNYEMGVAGAGLLLFSTWMDCTDGEVARLKFMESSLGKQLDIFCDNLVHITVFFSIGLGLYHSTGKEIFILLGSLAVLGSLVSFILLKPEIIENKSQQKKSRLEEDGKKSFVDKLANRDFTYLLFVMALVERLDLFLGLTAVGANLFAGYLLYSKVNKISPSIEKI